MTGPPTASSVCVLSVESEDDKAVGKLADLRRLRPRLLRRRRIGRKDDERDRKRDGSPW